MAIFDIEATGVNRKVDRIIDLAILILRPDGKREEHAYRVNPGVPIPREATAVHGITDADVAGAPTFKQQAPQIAKLLEGCDLGGFNILYYDIPMLCEEFARAGVPFSTEGRRVVDAQRIYHKKEPRDLTAALRYYCGELHLGAHGAMEDVVATTRVLEAQLERYDDLPRDLAGLDAFCNPRDPSWADQDGKLKWVGDDLVINFGQKQGKKLVDLVKDDSKYLDWILKGDFRADTKAIIENAKRGQYPTRPAVSDED